MTPDFEYFLRMKVESTISHTLFGLFVFNLPLAILVSIIFHQIVKKELIVNLPYFFQSRLELVKDSDWILYLKDNILIVSVSVIIGAASHLFWDAFTHKTGYFVENIGFLQSTISGFPVYKIMQHFSTLLGLTFIAYVFWKLPASKLDFNSKISFRFWISVALMVFLFQCLRFLTGQLSFKIGNLIVSSISVFVIALVLVCLSNTFQKKNRAI